MQTPALYKKHLFALRLINMFFGSTQAIYAQRVLMMQENGLTPTQIGIILCISSIIGALSPIIGGAIADKLRSKYKVFVIALLGAAATMILAPATAPVKLLGSTLLMITMPMYQVFLPAASNMVESSSVNATYLIDRLDYSRLRIFMSFGYTAANLFYTPLVGKFGINAPFYFSVVFFAAMLLLRNTIGVFENLPEDLENPQAPKEEPTQKLDFSKLVKSYYLVTFVLLNILFTCPSSSNSFLSYLLDELKIDSSMIGLVAGIRVFGEVIILFVLPFLKRFLSIPMLQVLAGVLQCIELLSYRFCSGVVSVSLVNLIGGMGWGIALGTAVLYLRVMAPKGLEATANSLWGVSFSISGVIMTFVCGRIIDLSGIFSVFNLGLLIESSWVILFCGSYAFGKYVLKKEPPIRFLKKQTPGRKA